MPTEIIASAENEIEQALWQSVRDNDNDKALAVYHKSRIKLVSLTNLSDAEKKNRDRVLAYCLMRIDDSLFSKGDTANAVSRAQEALSIAQSSEDAVQIARCQLTLGARLMNQGKIAEAEEHFRGILTTHMNSEDEDLIQVVGWTLITRGHLLNAKSLHDQALFVLLDAENRLKSIDNFAGIAAANELLVKVYSNLGWSEDAQKCRRMAIKYKEKAKREQR
ncbi:MAG: hypothetical protein GQ580_06480 [Candidatus Thorarchaeota archaeon]|nr:hypothetical protein [Candidatus Thorarchaeota archaeon]